MGIYVMNQLFFTKKFRIHRLWELFYHPTREILVWTLPLTGFIQSIIACKTFTFLPSTDGKIQGYYSDKRTMSYDWILENIYFSGLLAFSTLYYKFNNYCPLLIE